MSLRLKLPLHGRSHLQNGSDPIPGLSGFIRYNFANTGGYLDVTATGDITFTAGDDFTVNINDLLSLLATGSMQMIAGGTGLVQSGQHLEIAVTESGEILDFETNNGDAQFALGTGDFKILSADVVDFNQDGDMIVHLESGKKVEVRDSSNNPIFQVREDASIHIKTGQTITADL